MNDKKDPKDPNEHKPIDPGKPYDGPVTQGETSGGGVPEPPPPSDGGGETSGGGKGP